MLRQLWHYVYFIVHLRQQHVTELTGIETRIHASLKIDRYGSKHSIDKGRPDLTWMDVNKVAQWRDDRDGSGSRDSRDQVFDDIRALLLRLTTREPGISWSRLL